MVSVSSTQLYPLWWKSQRGYDSYFTTSAELKFEVPCFRSDLLFRPLCYECPSIWLTLSPQWAGLVCTRSWEGTQPGQLTWDGQRDMRYHMTSCSAIKAAGKEKGGMFMVMVFVFPSNRYTGWNPAFQEVVKYLPANGKQWKNSLLCFACVCSFCFTY